VTAQTGGAAAASPTMNVTTAVRIQICRPVFAIAASCDESPEAHSRDPRHPTDLVASMSGTTATAAVDVDHASQTKRVNRGPAR
jgi:hypothetical protein